MNTRHVLVAAALVVGGVGLGGAGLVLAQDAATFDASQLPAIKGQVAQYSLTPRGDVDGLILSDGMEVHLPPHLGTQLVFSVKPGDAVTIHGLRARNLPMVQAMSVSNDATGNTVTDNGPGGPPKPGGPPNSPLASRGGMEQGLTAQGRIKEQLHGPRGDLNGALLEDGTIVRLPPPEAQRLAAELVPGAPLFVRGAGLSSSLGRVIEAQAIGPNQTQLAQIAAPPPPPPGPGRHPPPPGRPGLLPLSAPDAPPPPSGPAPSDRAPG